MGCEGSWVEIKNRPTQKVMDGGEGVRLFKRAQQSERDWGQGSGQEVNTFGDKGRRQGLTELVYGWQGKEWEVEK